jgi:hypothetical protein
MRRATWLPACALLLGGCGWSGLALQADMPAEQKANLVFQRVILFPLTVGVSEGIAVAATIDAGRREAVLGAPGGLAAAADRAGAEAAYQDQIRPSLDLEDPFTRFLLETRLWLAGEVDAGRAAPGDALAVLARMRAEVAVYRARRENFAPAAPSLRRSLWAAVPGATLESLQQETQLYRRYRLDCPSERTWGSVTSTC